MPVVVQNVFSHGAHLKNSPIYVSLVDILWRGPHHGSSFCFLRSNYGE